METKICSTCKEVRKSSDFCEDKKAKSGLKSQCKHCVAVAVKKRYWENPEAYREKTRLAISKNRDFYNENRRKKRATTYISEAARKYGCSRERIEQLLSIGFCEICGVGISMASTNSHLKPNIDHSHKSGKVRGVLCGYCNNLLGRAKDDKKILQRSIAYLEERGE